MCVRFARLRWVFAFSNFFFFFLAAQFEFSINFKPHKWVPCTIHETRKPHFSATFSLKMGLKVLFTHLKIILLQYFQFSIFSYIQTDPKKNLHKKDKSHIKWDSFTRKAREALRPKRFSSMCVLILLQPYRSITSYVRIIMLFDIIISSDFIMNKLLNFICEIINYIFVVWNKSTGFSGMRF